MKNPVRTLLTCTVLFLFSCEEPECCDEKTVLTGLAGTWLLYEQGHSPGGGYLTKAVPADPSQTITFYQNGTLTSDGIFTDYKYYRIINNQEVMIFYKSDPGNEKPDPSKVNGSFTYSLGENKLVLFYRGCTEGCHAAFKRMD